MTDMFLGACAAIAALYWGEKLLLLAGLLSAPAIF